VFRFHHYQLTWMRSQTESLLQ